MLNRKLFFLVAAILGALSVSASATVITLDGTGPTGTDVPDNLALSGTPFAVDALADGGIYDFHTIGALNDGKYGNGSSWIGNGASLFAGINLNGTFLLDGFAFGRDNTGGFTDRSDGSYTVQVTNQANPDASTVDSSWTTLGSVAVAGTPIRKLYSFDAPVLATGFRLLVPVSGPFNTRSAIDEIELFGTAVPAPATLALFGLGLAGLGWKRRKKA